MSWSFNAIGQPANLKKALDAQSEGLTGDPKEEFDAAKPHLAALIDMNVSPLEGFPVIHVQASGHATRVNGLVNMGTCTVVIASMNSKVV
jgi:hypothetical protein